MRECGQNIHKVNLESGGRSYLQSYLNLVLACATNLHGKTASRATRVQSAAPLDSISWPVDNGLPWPRRGLRVAYRFSARPETKSSGLLLFRLSRQTNWLRRVTWLRACRVVVDHTRD